MSCVALTDWLYRFSSQYHSPWCPRDAILETAIGHQQAWYWLCLPSWTEKKMTCLIKSDDMIIQWTAWEAWLLFSHVISRAYTMFRLSSYSSSNNLIPNRIQLYRVCKTNITNSRVIIAIVMWFCWWPPEKPWAYQAGSHYRAWMTSTPFILQSQQHSCWKHGDWMSQGIGSNGIYTCLGIFRVKPIFIIVSRTIMTQSQLNYHMLQISKCRVVESATAVLFVTILITFNQEFTMEYRWSPDCCKCPEGYCNKTKISVPAES